MEFIVNNRIQIIVTFVSLVFLVYIIKKIVNGKLREEYSIIWLTIVFIILLFSIWREGIELISSLLGIYSAPNFIFTVAIFFIYIYLIHLSIVNTKQQSSIKSLIQRVALLEEKLKSKGEYEDN